MKTDIRQTIRQLVTSMPDRAPAELALIHERLTGVFVTADTVRTIAWQIKYMRQELM